MIFELKLHWFHSSDTKAFHVVELCGIKIIFIWSSVFPQNLSSPKTLFEPPTSPVGEKKLWAAPSVDPVTIFLCSVVVYRSSTFRVPPLPHPKSLYSFYAGSMKDKMSWWWPFSDYEMHTCINFCFITHPPYMCVHLPGGGLNLSELSCTKFSWVLITILIPDYWHNKNLILLKLHRKITGLKTFFFLARKFHL